MARRIQSIHLQNLKTSVDSRFSQSGYPAVDWKNVEPSLTFFIGAVEVYSQALWLTLDGLAQHAVDRVALELHAGSEESGFHQLKIIGASEAVWSG